MYKCQEELNAETDVAVAHVAVAHVAVVATPDILAIMLATKPKRRKQISGEKRRALMFLVVYQEKPRRRPLARGPLRYAADILAIMLAIKQKRRKQISGEKRRA
jgi:hypothetical protein